MRRAVTITALGLAALAGVFAGVQFWPADEAARWSADAIAIADAPPDHPAAKRQGWCGLGGLKHTAAWAALQPRFQLVHPRSGEPVWQDNERANVRLWQDIAAAAGEIPENIPQEIGDCTAWGAKHAIEATLGAQLIRGPPGEFHGAYAPWSYGAARVWAAKGAFGREDGCSGASTARAVRDYGVLPEDAPGVPPYDGDTARKWGAQGPPEKFKAIAAQHKVKTVAQLWTVDDVRDAVCNRFGVTVASNWGTKNSAMRVQDGRLVAKRSGSWSHQMAIIGYDGSAPSGRKYFYVYNSWGPQAHPAPVDDAPPGGFWVEASEVEFMLRLNDTWAYSDFEGFPAELDVSPLLPKRAAAQQPTNNRRAAARPFKGSVL